MAGFVGSIASLLIESAGVVGTEFQFAPPSVVLNRPVSAAAYMIDELLGANARSKTTAPAKPESLHTQLPALFVDLKIACPCRLACKGLVVGKSVDGVIPVT